MKAPSIPRRTWLIASTVAVIGGFFAYYFFVYMEARRADLEAKKFRALAQYADNIRGAYGERTKKLILRYSSGECREGLKKRPADCDSDIEFRQARLDVIKSVIAQSDFSELVFMVDRELASQTFRNTIDGNIVNDIFRIEDAGNKRRVEFTVNDKDYVIFIHSFTVADKTWKIFGFCDKNEFESQVRAVDLKYIVVVSLTLILILLMMPLLKLLIMNESEKLHVINVWFCGFSLVVGSSFLLLIALMASDFSASYSSINRDKADSLCREERIQILSQEIENSLKKELRRIFNQIQESRSGGYPNAVPCDSGNPNLVLYSPEVLNSVQFKSYPFFNELLWIMQDGWQDTIMATHPIKCDEHVNLKTRKYFSQALHNDSSWSMPDSDSGTERFALQSIHSYQTNRREAGFGTLRIKDDPSCGVLAIATKLHSVMDPLLPPGYQFVIVDANGKVWFHSKTEKNLNENFIDETGEDQTLIAAIDSRSDHMITLNYDRSSHRALVRPIRNTGLTLAVLHDNDFFNTPIVLTVGFAFLMLSMLFITLGFHQLIMLASTYRFSLLKVRRFFLAWLRPEKEKRRIYRRAVWLQVFLLIPTGCLALFNNSLDLVIFFLVLPIYLTVYHYFSIERRRIAEESGSQGKGKWPHPFLIASFLMILFVNFGGIYLFQIEQLAFLIFAQIFVIAILLFFYSWIVLRRLFSPILSVPWSATNRVLGFTTRAFRVLRLPSLSNRFDRSYYNFLFLWLILTSFIPTYYFYKVSYYEEGKIWMRYLQLKAAHEEELRDVKLNNELGRDFKDSVEQIAKKGNFLTVTGEIDTTKYDTIQFCNVQPKPIHELVFNDVPRLTGIAEETRAAIFPLAGDSMWTSTDHNLASQLVYYTKHREQRFYRSELPKYKVFKGDYGIFFLVIIMLGLIVLYRTLRFCITHIFGLGLLQGDRYKTPKLLPGVRYFIVGLPHSGRNTLIIRIRRKEKIMKNNVTTVQLNDTTPVEIRSNCKLIVAKGFHLDLNNHESNQNKLSRMEILFHYKDVPVIVLSDIDPSAILEFYNKLADYYRHEKGDCGLDGNSVNANRLT